MDWMTRTGKLNGQGVYFWLFFFFFYPGTFAECSSEAEVQHWMRYNIFLLLDVGTFSALVELLNMEIEYVFVLFF